MHLVVVGVNHNTAPIDIREKLSIDKSEINENLKELRSNPRIREACILSTCNRTEIYAVINSRQDDTLLINSLAKHSGIRNDIISSHSYKKPGHHATKHLFNVVCGLDSMALGEYQILGQVKSAFLAAENTNATGPILNHLFKQAIAVGKRARTQTGISSGTFSIGAAAVKLAERYFSNLRKTKVLLLGSGEMSSLAAVHFRASGVENIYLASRTFSKVQNFADQYGCVPIQIEKIEDCLKFVDVVVCSTSASYPILTKNIMRLVMDARQHVPILLIDIAVPRNVDPDVDKIEGIVVYDIDNLKGIIDNFKQKREAETAKVIDIINEEVASFMSYLKTLEVVPVIKDLRAKFESIYENEWAKCSSKLTHISYDDKEHIRKSLKSIVKKITHDPILRIKEYAENDENEKLDVVRELFGISSDFQLNEFIDYEPILQPKEYSNIK